MRDLTVHTKCKQQQQRLKKIPTVDGSYNVSAGRSCMYIFGSCFVARFRLPKTARTAHETQRRRNAFAGGMALNHAGKKVLFIAATR